MASEFKKKKIWCCEIKEFSMRRNHVLKDSSKMASTSDPDKEVRTFLSEERLGTEMFKSSFV